MSYRIEIASKRVEKQLDAVSNQYYDPVAEAIQNLAEEPRPRGVTKLGGRVHRIRIGPYRVIYSIYDQDRVIVIDKVDRRKERTYRDL